MSKIKHYTKKEKSFKKIFVQGYGTHTDQILVAVGVSRKEILSYLKKVKARPEYIDFIKKTDDKFFENKGTFAWNDKVDGTILYLKKYEDLWDFWETLIHELHHAIEHFRVKKAMQDEPEALAYQQEFLFRAIRRKLQGMKDV